MLPLEMFSPKPQLSRATTPGAAPAGPRTYARGEPSAGPLPPEPGARRAQRQVGVYQSAWTAVPLCSVATVPLALHSTMALRSCQLSIASCQCLGTPAGDS